MISSWETPTGCTDLAGMSLDWAPRYACDVVVTRDCLRPPHNDLTMTIELRRGRQFGRPRHKRGQGMIEYALILGLVGIIALALLRVLGTQTHTSLCSTSNGLNGGSAAVLSCQVIYVSDSSTSSIVEFQGGSSGGTTPLRTISGAATGLSGVGGVALDSAGNLYVANSTGGGGSGSVTVFAPGAGGNVRANPYDHDRTLVAIRTCL